MIQTAVKIKENIKKNIAENEIILFMKGSPDMPRCGFSAKAVQLLKACGTSFVSVDVFEHPEVRQYLPEVSDWPTFPQLFVKGELVGGCDIMTDLYEKGELEDVLKGITS
jgi:monothiol glutaredoxin